MATTPRINSSFNINGRALYEAIVDYANKYFGKSVSVQCVYALRRPLSDHEGMIQSSENDILKVEIAMNDVKGDL